MAGLRTSSRRSERNSPVCLDEKENIQPKIVTSTTSNTATILSMPKGMIPSTPTAGCKSNGQGPLAQLSVNTPLSLARANPATPLNQLVKLEGDTPAGQVTGIAPKRLEEWDKILRTLPTATAQDRARLDRLYERALGSGKGNEELDVSSHKDKKEYVSLWLRRIQLDPDEGPTYMKFVRNCGIGRKFAAIYVQQAMMFSPEKGLKALQEGIDAAAQPLKLLQEILAAVATGKQPSQASQEIFEAYPEVRSMLGVIDDANPLPSTVADTPNRCDSTSTGALTSASSKYDTELVGSSKNDNERGKEETVTFGSKKADATVRSDTTTSQKHADTEDTVIFSSKLQSGTPSQTKRPTAVAEDTGVDKGTSIKGRPIRALKSLGLQGGARRVNTASATESTSNNGERGSQAGDDALAPIDHARIDQGLSSAEEEGAPAGAQRMIRDSGDTPSSPPLLDPNRQSDGSNVELSPITELDGSHGGEANSSIASSGSNDSVHRTRTQAVPQLVASNLSDETTQPHYMPPAAHAAAPHKEAVHCSSSSSIANDETIASHGQSSGRRDCYPPESAAEARRRALCLGHLAQFPPESVPKGHIAVCGQIYKKVEVKGKGGGGKVYKVHRVEDEESVWAIKKIKLDPGDEDLRESVFNEIELLVRMRGHGCIIQMHDYEVGDDYVYMVMECGEQVRRGEAAHIGGRARRLGGGAARG
jgi:hypothetical protein